MMLYALHVVAETLPTFVTQGCSSHTIFPLGRKLSILVYRRNDGERKSRRVQRIVLSSCHAGYVLYEHTTERLCVSVDIRPQDPIVYYPTPHQQHFSSPHYCYYYYH